MASGLRESVKRGFKSLLYRIAPEWTTAVLSARARRQFQQAVRHWGGDAVTRQLVDRLGSHVQEGPFAGLQLAAATHAEQIGPFLLGVYESELDAAWATVFRGEYSQIIDIGARFGFYAVGMARRYPRASVVAFDTDWWARKAIREMAAANDVKNVDVRGFCRPQWLTQHVEETAFILSDCEGYEAALFSPGTMPSLASATLIIETHDCFVPGIAERLQATFAKTHTLSAIRNDGPRRGTTRNLDFLTDAERQLATQEARLQQPQVWLLCLPKSGPNRSLASETCHAGRPTIDSLPAGSG